MKSKSDSQSQSQPANPKTQPGAASDGIANQQKNPSDWVTGDEPMTGAQASYLKTLSEQKESTEAFDSSLSKAEASKRIDALRQQAP